MVLKMQKLLADPVGITIGFRKTPGGAINNYAYFKLLFDNIKAF